MLKLTSAMAHLRWHTSKRLNVSRQRETAPRLRMAPARCMQVAEGLYQRGFISYPRTNKIYMF